MKDLHILPLTARSMIVLIHSDKMPLKFNLQQSCYLRQFNFLRPADGVNDRSPLGWPSLVDERKIQKFCLCKHILLGGSLIPATCFQHHQLVHLHHANSKPLCRKAARTNYCKQSFFVSTMPLWNGIPEVIVAQEAASAFKKQLKQHFF